MSKQDIEKRLAFAAQCVKAEMAHIPGITGEAYEPNPQGTHRYKVGDQVKDKRHPSFQGTIKRLMRDKYGYPSYVVYTQGGGPQDAQDSDLVLAARPGVKAKFDREVGRKGNKSAMITKNGPDADASWLAYVVQHHGEGQGESVLGTMRSYSTEARAKAAALRGLETSGLRGGFARPGVKAKFADAALNQIRNNAAISDKIRTLVSKGLSVPQAIDSVLGEGTYKRIGSEVYDELRKDKSSRPGVKAEMAAPANWEAKLELKNLAGSFDIENLRELLGASKEFVSRYPQYKALGQKLVDGSNMVMSAIKQMKAESLKAARPGAKAKMAFPSASTASSRTEELLRKELSRIAGEGYIQYKGRSKINTLKSKSDFLQMIGDLRSHLAPLQKKWVSKSEQEQDAAGSLEASSALNTISGALKKLDQITTMANGVTTAARPGAKAKMAASDIIVKKDAQYIYYYPEDDDRATFADDNGKGAYTVKSNRTGKPVSAKTYRSLQEAVSASNPMTEKLPPLKKAKASRPGAKAKMETPMRVALTPMHTRAEQGYENFIAVLMKFGGITREQAQKAFKAFKDAKVLVTKEQYMGGGITVKHGAFMERDVIRRAAGLPEESSRPGSKAKA